MSHLSKLILSVVFINLLMINTAPAGDKTQAWGARLNSFNSVTMRSRNQNARAWIGEQARGWGLGSRITNTLTTSSSFHLQSSKKALDNIKSNNDQTNFISVSACGTCVNLQNTGNNFSINNTSINSVNNGSTTSAGLFNN